MAYIDPTISNNERKRRGLPMLRGDANKTRREYNRHNGWYWGEPVRADASLFYGGMWWQNNRPYQTAIPMI